MDVLFALTDAVVWFILNVWGLLVLVTIYLLVRDAWDQLHPSPPDNRPCGYHPQPRLVERSRDHGTE